MCLTLVNIIASTCVYPTMSCQNGCCLKVYPSSLVMDTTTFIFKQMYYLWKSYLFIYFYQELILFTLPFSLLPSSCLRKWTELNSVVQLSLNYLNLHVRSFGWHKFGNLCYTQCICLPSCPFMAHPLPYDPVGQRGPVFRRKHSTGHITHTDTQTHHCSGTAGVRRWAGNGVYPLLEAISCPWVKLVYLSSDLSSLCACVRRSIHVGEHFKNPETIQNCF